MIKFLAMRIKTGYLKLEDIPNETVREKVSEILTDNKETESEE